MTSIRERIEHGSRGEVYSTLKEALLAEWNAGNLIPADKVETRVAEAVEAERERCARIADSAADGYLAAPYAERVSRAIAAAIREGESHDG